MTRRRGTGSHRIKAPEVTAQDAAPPPEAVALARAAAHSLLVFESGKGNRQRAEELAVGLGYRILSSDQPEEAQRMLDGDAPPDLVLVGLPGGEAVARAVKTRAQSWPLSMIIASSGDTGEGLALTERHGADTFVLRPYKRDALAAALRAGITAREERSRRQEVEAMLRSEKLRLARHGEADPVSGFYHFEFFKRVLVIELKRAGRYGYSLAACLVAMDEKLLDGIDATVRGILLGQVAEALRGKVRDIDLPVDYADGRFLVFLPYTDVKGAEQVGRRIEAAVRGAEGVEQDGRLVQPTVSVGIAALKQGKTVSFSRLVHDASLALRAAQLKGGGRVVVKS